MEKELNWQEIQSYYDSGKTWRDIVSQYQINFIEISQASKRGLFISLRLGVKLAEHPLKTKGSKGPKKQG